MSRPGGSLYNTPLESSCVETLCVHALVWTVFGSWENERGLKRFQIEEKGIEWKRGIEEEGGFF